MVHLSLFPQHQDFLRHHTWLIVQAPEFKLSFSSLGVKHGTGRLSCPRLGITDTHLVFLSFVSSFAAYLEEGGIDTQPNESRMKFYGPLARLENHSKQCHTGLSWSHRGLRQSAALPSWRISAVGLSCDLEGVFQCPWPPPMTYTQSPYPKCLQTLSTVPRSQSLCS